MAGRDRARRSRESGSAVFAGAVSSREIRQRIAPSGGIPTIPAPSAPMPWIATDRSKAATRSPSLSTRARTLLDASASTAANLTAAAVPSDASDVESPPTSPDASTSSRPRLPTSTAERKRAMLVDAMAKVEVTRPPPTLTTRRGDGTRSASSTPLGSDDDDTAKEDGDATSSSSSPSSPPSSPTFSPLSPARIAPGAKNHPRPHPRRRKQKGEWTPPEEDSRRDGFPRGGRDDAFRDSLRSSRSSSTRSSAAFSAETARRLSRARVCVADESETSVARKRRTLREWKRDFAEWRSRRGVSPGAKVFVCVGSYSDVRACLLRRGWVENPDPESPFFDLKWTLRARDALGENLRDCQTVNHFAGAAACLTTKAGLLRSLRQIHWQGGPDVDSFFPRCYDLAAESDETRAFEVDFRWTLAQSLVRRALRDDEAPTRDAPSAREVDLALRVCRQRIEYDEALTAFGGEDDAVELPALSDAEWASLESSSALESQIGDVDAFGSPGTTKPARSKPPSPATLEECRRVLERLDARNAQASIEGCANVWIAKPAGKSRGRGIACVTRLEDLRAHVKAQASGALDEQQSRWVVQKYIERPLVIHRRKFDVRQWVLLTSTAPLTVWVYDQPYLRFCAEDYAVSDVGNPFRHLSNNSVAKHSDAFGRDALGEGNMWRVETFKKYLHSMGHPESDWDTVVAPQIRSAVVDSLRCAEDTLEPRKNTCELFGYDFVVDERMKVWLLEVNSSPSMEHSTPITEELCPRAFDDVFKVIVDAPARRAFDASRGAARPLDEYDVGGWRLAHEGDRSKTRASSNVCPWGVDLTVKGEGDTPGGKGPFTRPNRVAPPPRSPGYDENAGGEDGGLPRAPAWERLSKLRPKHRGAIPTTTKTRRGVHLRERPLERREIPIPDVTPKPRAERAAISTAKAATFGEPLIDAAAAKAATAETPRANAAAILAEKGVLPPATRRGDTDLATERNTVKRRPGAGGENAAPKFESGGNVSAPGGDPKLTVVSLRGDFDALGARLARSLADGDAGAMRGKLVRRKPSDEERRRASLGTGGVPSVAKSTGEPMPTSLRNLFADARA